MAEEHRPEQPDKTMPVEPETSTPGWMRQVVNGVLYTGGGVITLAAIAVTCTPTMGATRSSKLEWQRRQQVIDAALAQEQADDSEETETRTE